MLAFNRTPFNRTAGIHSIQAQLNGTSSATCSSYKAQFLSARLEGNGQIQSPFYGKNAMELRRLAPGESYEIDTQACTVRKNGVLVYDYKGDFFSIPPGSYLVRIAIQSANPNFRTLIKIAYTERYL